MSAPALMGVGRLASEMGVCRKTIWNYTAQGVIPNAAVVRVGRSRRCRYRRVVLERAGLLTPAVTP